MSDELKRGVGLSAGRPLTVTGRGGELQCDCTKAQYELLTRTCVDNLAGRADPAHASRLSVVLESGEEMRGAPTPADRAAVVHSSTAGGSPSSLPISAINGLTTMKGSLVKTVCKTAKTTMAATMRL